MLKFETWGYLFLKLKNRSTLEKEEAQLGIVLDPDGVDFNRSIGKLKKRSCWN